MRVIECPFCNGGLPIFMISFKHVIPEIWLECSKCHNKTAHINCTYMNWSDPDVCMKDRKKLGKMWNGWQFVGVSEKVAKRK